MATRKKKQAGIVRCFEVSDPTLHQKGHTIYKITQRVIIVDCPEEEVQEVVVWRRYNDFKRLYKAMSKLHQALHRVDEFPPFVEGKLFGRFEEEVLKRRMLCAQDLLNFVGQRNYLVASRAFQQFFEGAELRRFDGPPALIPPVTLSQKLVDDLDDVDFPEDCPRPRPDGEDSSVLAATGAAGEGPGELLAADGTLRKAPSYNQLLGGVWRYRQIAEEISLGGDEDDEDTDYTDDSALSTPLPSAELSFFDPLNKPDGSSDEQFEQSNEWILSQPDNGEEEELKKLEEEFAAVGVSSVSLEGDSNQTSGTSSPVDDADGVATKSGSVVECGKGDLLLSPMHVPKPAGININRSPLNSLAATPSASPLHSATNSAKGSPARSPLRQNLVNIEVKDKADYIFLAANQISLAQQCEANANYHMAFSYYKSAVGIMLTGVQMDDNRTRLEVVRKKTAKYLLKAEELYHKYLDSREQVYHGERWDTGAPSPAKELDPNVAFLQGSISELKSFKVLGVIERVLLVLDTLSDQTFVIKVLHKGCCVSPTHRNLVPVHLPYTVQLHRFYETETAIYLLLQHATGGRLWTYVSGFMQQQQHNDGDLENILNDPHERRLRQGEGERVRAGTGDSEKTVVAQDSETTVVSKESVPAQEEPKEIRIGMSGVKFVKTEEGSDTANTHSDVPKQNGSSTVDADKAKLQKEVDGDNFSLEDGKSSTLPQKELKNSSALGEGRKIHVRGSSSDFESRESTSTDQWNDAGGNRFEDILKGANMRPTLEQFSINSFDSDCGQPTRYESVTSADHIECIPEVSETSPLASPMRKTKTQSTSSEEVFNYIPEENSESSTLRSALTVIKDAAEELDDDVLQPKDPAGIQDFSDLEPKVAQTGDRNTNLSSSPEASIYDKYTASDGDSDASTPVDIPNSLPKPVTKPETKPLPIEKPAPSQPIDKLPTPVTSPSKSLDSGRGMIRLPSQERSVELDRKPKKRHLSAMFGSFNADDAKPKASARIPEGCVKQWAAEMLLAISSVHAMGIICRDLQPHNVLLGDRGHILLTFISQWNCVDINLDMDAKDNLYSAPEIGGVNKVTAACDWWSFGALVYELLTGKTLCSCHPSGVTSHTLVSVPDYLSPEAQSLLKDLLKFHPEERLGAGSGGDEEIRMHPFFSGIDWISLQG